MEKNEAAELSALKLAYVGDGVHTLFVREHVLKKEKGNMAKVAKEANKLCNAAAQQMAYFKILDLLTEDEKSVAMRARNANLHHGAKNFSIEEYRHATAFEAVVGYLYLTNQKEKLKKVLQLSLEGK